MLLGVNLLTLAHVLNITGSVRVKIGCLIWLLDLSSPSDRHMSFSQSAQAYQLTSLHRLARCFSIITVVMVAFSSRAKIWGECSTIHSPPALFFLKWRLARSHLIHSLGQDQPTVAERAEATVTECSLTSCAWARFLIGSHTMPGQRRSQPTPTSLGQRCMRV